MSTETPDIADVSDIKPDIVHVMVDGRIVHSGGPELALVLEEKGYDWAREELAAAA